MPAQLSAPDESGSGGKEISAPAEPRRVRAVAAHRGALGRRTVRCLRWAPRLPCRPDDRSRQAVRLLARGGARGNTGSSEPRARTRLGAADNGFSTRLNLPLPSVRNHKFGEPWLVRETMPVDPRCGLDQFPAQIQQAVAQL